MDECQAMIKLPCVTEHTSASVVVITALFSQFVFTISNFTAEFMEAKTHDVQCSGGLILLLC